MKIIVFYHSPRVKKLSRKAREEIKSLTRFCASSCMAVAAVGPPSGMQTITAATFGLGGPGTVIVQLLLMALVGYLAAYLAAAVGQGQIAGMIKVVTVFSCLAVVASTLFRALETFAKFVG